MPEKIEEEVCSFIDNYADEEVGGYPMLDVANQIGGRAYLCQALDDPICLSCETYMYFIASITNDDKNNIHISFDSVQIIFFYCPSCMNIHVQHSV